MSTDKVINMELEAFYETLIILISEVIKVEGKKTNMVGRM